MHAYARVSVHARCIQALHANTLTYAFTQHALYFITLILAFYTHILSQAHTGESSHTYSHIHIHTHSCECEVWQDRG